ncbi:TPA: YadA-like family protein [Stenotrophomonas maltophilia]|nr:YadA-like family protein [Stenotrophomonas maltophilia]
MNHIYRRIWSTARKCWVVASELSSARGKSTGQPTRMAAAAVILASLVVPAASAEDGTEERDEGIPIARQAVERERVHPFVAVLTAAPAMSPPVPVATVKAIHAQLALVSDTSYRDSTISGNDMLVLGSRSSLSSGNRSVGYGNAISSRGENNTAIGHNAEITSGYSTAVGAFSRTSGIGATALGHDARATSSNAIALGSGAQASSSNSVAIGANSVANSSYTVSVGSTSNQRKIVNVARGSTAYGSTDAVTGGQLYETNQDVSSVRSTANSAYSNASSALSTANTAKSNADNALAKANIREGLLNQASVSGNVRIGASNSGTTLDIRNSANVNRKIAGIAAGAVNAASADAVNGSQLYATDQTAKAAKAAADSALAQSTTASYLLANGNTPTVAMRAQATGTGALATGIYTEANGTAAMAVGRTAKAKADGAIALGDRASVGNGTSKNSIAIGTTATTGVQEDLMAIGRNATASGGVGAMALGANSAAGHLRSVALGSGSVTTAQDQVSVGSTSIKRKIINVADATLNSSSTEAVTGRQLNATNTNVSTALSDASLAKANANTALTEVGTLKGLLSQDGASGDVRIGEKNSGTVLDVRNSANANRKLTGVADGVVSASSYEAVNGRQLSATNDKVTTVEGVARSAGEDAAVAKTDAAKALTETAALGGLVAQVSATGSVRLGEKNSGTTVDVRNSANVNRKISGVAGGLLSASSAEAVSGRQLFATNSRISDLESANLYVSVGTDSFSERADAALLGVAIGDSAKAGAEGATALGGFARALSKNSVAVGRGAGVSGGASDGFAMGAGAQVHAISGVAIGAGAVVEDSAVGSLALGADSGADEAGIASFGNATTQRRLTYIARGTADHNATTVSQLKDSLATLGGGASVDASGNIIAPTYAMQGGTQSTVEDALMALDGAVITAGRRVDKVEGQLSSIFQESPSARADGMNQIALNGVNGMVLTNLADGRVAPGSRDAVTGSQLYAAEQKISQNRNDLETMRKERGMGAQSMRGLDASVIDYGGARLTGVAEAKLLADSSDVVRGSQLYSTNGRLDALEELNQFLSVGTGPTTGPAEAGRAGVALGVLAKAGTEGGTAIGSRSLALGVNSVALGRGSTVFNGSDFSIAIGTGAEVGTYDGGTAVGGIALGIGARVRNGADGSMALGFGSYATEVGVASFGNGEMKRRLINIANGTANHNAATVGQLRGALSALGGEVDADGNIVGPSFNVQGQSRSTLNGALEALDGAVVSTTSRVNQVESQLRSVFQETPSARADGTQQLTLAGANGMVISNVANGLIAAGSRDAVNGGQLHSMQQQINGRMDGLEKRIDDRPQARAMAAASTPSPSTEEIAPASGTSGSPQIASTGEGDKPTPQPKSKQDDTPKPQVDTADLEKMLARANEYTDGAISNFERRLDKMDKRFNRMAAMSSAQTAMAMNTAGLATYNRLGAGVGYSEGESAMAVGYQRVLNEKGSATFSLNGAFTNSGERSMGVGVGIGW